MGVKKNVGKTLALALTGLSLTTGCSEQLLSTINSSSQSGTAFKGTCSIKEQQAMAARIRKLNQETTSPNSFSDQKPKFDINDFADSTNNFSPNNAALNTLQKGTQIILTVNRLCAQNNPESLPETKLVNQLVNTKNENIMQEQSLLWKLPKDMTTLELQKIAQASDCILSLSINKKLDLLSQNIPNDTHYSKLTHLKALGYEYLYNKVINKPESNYVTVAVIDTGNDIVHADMVGRSWENTLEKNGITGADDDGNGFTDDINGYNFGKKSGDVTDEYGIPHGEHVAGLIAANVNNNVGVVGLASHRVKVMHLNVFGASHLPGMGGEDPLLLMENAIRYAADNGAKVINLSVGRTGSSITAYNALSYAVNKGVFIAASAGNNYEEITAAKPFFPAMYGAELSGMMAVGAADSFDGNMNGKCGFSNYSTQYVEITAPGCDTKASDSGLLSLGIFNMAPYVYMAGTSMSGPLVAASAAVVISYIQEKSGVMPTNILVKKILKMGGKKMAIHEPYVQNGNVLDMPSVFSYIDNEILQMPAACQ